jgi:hypothetical protein
MHKKTDTFEPGPTDMLAPIVASQMAGLGLTEMAEASRDERQFPMPVNLAAPGARKRAPRYVRREVLAWLQAQIDKRDVELARQREAVRRQEQEDRELLRVADRERAVTRESTEA